jgi:NAD(P)-dependent dehydrogenase (short-subunit alcohol dehydrogenase family)
MDLQIAGEVAVVVGGARGLGRAIARAFADEGAHLALLDREADVAATARGLADAHRARVDHLVADIADPDAVRQAFDAVLDRFGRLDHVVVAAAIGSGKFGFPFWRLDPSDWDRVLRVNIQGAVHVAHAAAPILVEAGRGTLLFLASVAGQIGSQTDPPYSASKAALINFMQCAAKDLAPHGVRVNALNPGMVQTALNRSVFESWLALLPEDAERPTYEDWAADKIRKLVPLNRWQTPEDIAAMAVFLASKRAENVTGQTINVDGGYVMHW